MTHLRILFHPFVCSAVFAAGCRGAGESLVSESTAAAPPAAWDTDADSMLHAGIVYRGRAAIAVEAGRPMLVVRVAVRNTRADTATVDSNAATCHPPLYFRPPSGGRTVAWSDQAWQSSTTPGVGCKGTALIVPLGSLGSGELETRRYPVDAVRGDSLSPGTYAVAVATVVYRSEASPRGIVTRFDTLLVPAGRVRLP